MERRIRRSACIMQLDRDVNTTPPVFRPPDEIRSRARNYKYRRQDDDKKEDPGEERKLASSKRDLERAPYLAADEPPVSSILLCLAVFRHFSSPVSLLSGSNIKTNVRGGWMTRILPLR